MKTTLPLALLFAAIMGGGIFIGHSFSLDIPFRLLVVLHILAICATGAFVLYADEQALLWVLGKKDRMSMHAIRFLHYAVALGLGIIIVTGATLFLPHASFYFGQTTFVVKMTAVAVLILNTYFIDTLSMIATRHRFSDISYTYRIPLLVSGGVSILGWATALLGGLLIQ
jgi:hypothetical protein